jgi:SET domain-containing protein 6
MSEFEQASNKFIEWLKANKAFISNDIEIKDYRMENAGRGVVATKEIKVGMDWVGLGWVSDVVLDIRCT